MVYVYGDDSRRIGIDIEIPGLRKHLFQHRTRHNRFDCNETGLLRNVETLNVACGKIYRVVCMFRSSPRSDFRNHCLGALHHQYFGSNNDGLKNKQYFNGVSGLFVAIGASAFFLGSTWGTTTTAYSPIYFIDGFSKLGSEVAFTSEYFTNQATIFNSAVTGTTTVGIAITVAMMIAYTIWNWLFVTGEFSSSVALMHVGFLLAPILGVFIGPLVGMGRFGMAPDPGLWLLFRASTLTFGGILQIGGKNWFEQNFYFEKFDKAVNYIKNSKPIQIACMVICCSLMVFAVVAGFVPAK